MLFIVTQNKRDNACKATRNVAEGGSLMAAGSGAEGDNVWCGVGGRELAL